MAAWQSAPNYGTDWRRYFSNWQHFDNVTDEFTPAAIRKVYLKRSLKLHPDKNPGDQAAATAAFKRLGRYKDLANRELAGPAAGAGAPQPPRPQPPRGASFSSQEDMAFAMFASKRYIYLLMNPKLNAAEKIAALRSKRFGVVYAGEDPQDGPRYTTTFIRGRVIVFIRFSRTKFLFRVILPGVGAANIDHRGKVSSSMFGRDRRAINSLVNAMLDSYASNKLKWGTASRPYSPRPAPPKRNDGPAAPGRKAPARSRWWRRAWW